MDGRRRSRCSRTCRLTCRAENSDSIGDKTVPRAGCRMRRANRAQEEDVMAKVKAVPDGLHSVTVHLRIDGAVDALALYARALGAEELPGRAMDPSGKKVWH